MPLFQRIGLFILTASCIVLAATVVAIFMFWFFDKYILADGRKSKAGVFFCRKIAVVVISIALACAFVGICMAVP